MITHVVLLTFADPTDAPEAKRRLDALDGAVPALRSLRADLDVLGLAGSAHLCLVTTHESADGLRAYAEHPAHRAVLDWLRPRLAGRSAVDYET